MDIFSFAPHPIIFVDFIWKYRTSITRNGILEEYCHIWSGTENTESIRLIKAYSVFYSWDNDSFTITLI